MAVTLNEWHNLGFRVPSGYRFYGLAHSYRSHAYEIRDHGKYIQVNILAYGNNIVCPDELGVKLINECIGVFDTREQAEQAVMTLKLS